MNHLAHHLDQPEEAIQLAQRGRKALQGGPPQPELEPRLPAMQARGFAAPREPDEACAVAAQVLDATQSLGSYLVIQQLLDLKQLLEAHRASKVVADVLVFLGQELKERLWLCQ